MLTRRHLMAASAATATLPLVPANAEAPKDMLVVGQQLDGILSLDPGEGFEVLSGEMIGNCYDRLLMADPGNTHGLKGTLADK
jgi:peptide/nickel transport system substrate-binding protein